VAPLCLEDAGVTSDSPFGPARVAKMRPDLVR